MARKPRAPKEDQRSEGESAQESLDAFGALLASKRSEAIDYRAGSGLERRWIDDEDAYQGHDELNGRPHGVLDAAQGIRTGGSAYTTGNPTQQIRARVYVHLTRQKTNAWAARVSDMLLPTDDRNWSIQPTPVPELSDAIKISANVEWGEKDPATGQMIPLRHPTQDRNVTIGDVVSEKLSEAQRRCEAMQKEIDDQLNECSYNKECRMSIMDAARLGVGVMKGPFVINRISKKWNQQQDEAGRKFQVLEVVEDTRPASKRVDPWDFFPDPACGDDIHNGQYVFERARVSAKRLRELAGVPGYLEDQIKACIEEGPQRAVPTSRESRDYLIEPVKDTRYELWTYTGEASREDLEAAGVEIPEDDALTTYSAVVVLCNSRVIKAVINPMDTGCFPYDTFVWEPVTNSWAGVGIPYLMRFSQKTINTAWRAMLDNAAVSYAPQIVINRSALHPIDGQWQITGRKLWATKGDVNAELDITKAFQSFTIPNNQTELQNIVNLSQKWVDDETALPQIAQGERGTAPDTVGGMTILMNSANAVLRRVVRQWDDMMTRPHISRYYDWNMQFNEKEEIKGDYQVDARGSSALVVRDEQAQELNSLMQGTVHPVFGKFIDPQKVLREHLLLKKIPADRVLRSEHEVKIIEQNQAKAPPSPALQVAEVRAKATIEAAQINAQGKAREQEIEAQSEQNNLMLERERNADQRAANMAELDLKYRMLLLEYANQKALTLEEVKAQLTGKIIDANTQKELKAADIAIAAKRDDQQAAQFARSQASQDHQFDRTQTAAERAQQAQERNDSKRI